MRNLANQGYVLIIVVALAWTGNPIVGRYVNESIPPIGLSFWRWVGTLPIFLIIAWPYLRGDWPTVRREWPMLLLLATLSISVYNTFIYFGLGHTTAINMLLINAGRPVLIVFLSYLVYRERITRLQALGLVFGFAGTMAILLRGNVTVLADVSFNIGDLWIVAATTVWALYTVLLPKRPRVHPTSFMAVTVTVGVTLLLPFYLWETFTFKPVPVTFETVWAVGYLSLFASVVAYLCYNRAVELLGPNKSSIVSYLVPVFGILLAILILGEAFHAYHAYGIVLLALGTYLVARTGARALKKV